MLMIHLHLSRDTVLWWMVRVVSIAAVAGFTAIWVESSAPARAAQVQTSSSQAGVLACPMHPDIRSRTAGTCRVCGMTLVPVESAAAAEYDVEIATPRGITAGRPFELRLVVRDRRTRAVVQDFAVVHEKRFHMFVIGTDLAHYDHIHPEQQADGSWTVDVTLPRSGRYRIYSDFLPAGGTPQVDNQPLVTSDVDVDDGSFAEGRLVPDRRLNHVVGNLSVTLELPAGKLLAGREETFVYTLADARTGRPVDDVEPYLGAWGHSLAVSENMSTVVHAHPVEHVPASRPTAFGGPTLTFKAALPVAGMYRIWTQIKRRGEISTAVFTVRVDPAARGPVGHTARRIK